MGREIHTDRHVLSSLHANFVCAPAGRVVHLGSDPPEPPRAYGGELGQRRRMAPNASRARWWLVRAGGGRLNIHAGGSVVMNAPWWETSGVQVQEARRGCGGGGAKSRLQLSEACLAPQHHEGTGMCVPSQTAGDRPALACTRNCSAGLPLCQANRSGEQLLRREATPKPAPAPRVDTASLVRPSLVHPSCRRYLRGRMLGFTVILSLSILWLRSPFQDVRRGAVVVTQSALRLIPAGISQEVPKAVDHPLFWWISEFPKAT